MVPCIYKQYVDEDCGEISLLICVAILAETSNADIDASSKEHFLCSVLFLFYFLCFFLNWKIISEMLNIFH